jgi:hypothetical protein
VIKHSQVTYLQVKLAGIECQAEVPPVPLFGILVWVIRVPKAPLDGLLLHHPSNILFAELGQARQDASILAPLARPSTVV